VRRPVDHALSLIRMSCRLQTTRRCADHDAQVMRPELADMYHAIEAARPVGRERIVGRSDCRRNTHTEVLTICSGLGDGPDDILWRRTASYKAARRSATESAVVAIPCNCALEKR
jgi:hypothetical protein